MLLLLPSDLFEYLCSFLEGFDLAPLMQVNSALYHRINKEAFWRHQLTSTLYLSTIREAVMKQKNRYHITIKLTDASVSELKIDTFDYSIVIGILIAAMAMNQRPEPRTIYCQPEIILPSGQSVTKIGKFVEQLGYWSYYFFPRTYCIFKMPWGDLSLPIKEGCKNPTIEATCQKYINIIANLLSL